MEVRPFAASESAAVLSPGKQRRMRRLCDAQGRFAMLAIDQRRSLRRLLARRLDVAEAAVPDAHLARVKQAVTGGVAGRATAVLTDPRLGYPATHALLPADRGVLLAAEVTGYQTVAGGERRSHLLDGWSADAVLRAGADAVKLLVWHHPEASAGTQRHQQALVERVGAACAAASLPFLLEVVTYALGGAARTTAAFARDKPALVVDAARTYADARFGVDLLKLEFPMPLGFVDAYQPQPFARREVLWQADEVTDALRALDAAATVPWVILSAGVGVDEFEANVRLAGRAGASGFLCGRAVWKDVAAAFPDAAAMAAFVRGPACDAFDRLRRANEGARPWTQHPRHAAPPASSPPPAPDASTPS